MTIANMLLHHTTVPEQVVHSLASRDAALWVGPGFGDTGTHLAQLQRLISLPWRLVLCESSQGRLALALEASAQETDQISQKRGFVHVVASDPQDLQLPPRVQNLRCCPGTPHCVVG
jgi:hypothetical protein